jgi:proteasome accessory factor A
VRSRVVGTETEYALIHRPDGEGRTRPVGDQSLLNHLKALTPLIEASLDRKGYLHAGQFLGNGGRFYIDRGAHPEYATPECASVRELVAHEKAGDGIVQELVEEASAQMADQGTAGTLSVFKNNVDSYGTTYGSHENYLVTPRAMDRIQLIVPFLVTRQVFAGAGRVMMGPEAASSPYRLSQRAEFIDRVFSDRTSQVRGIINLRKREIPRQDQNRRLHLLVGDSNMSECSIKLKVGATALVLRLIEEEGLEDIPALTDPVQAIKEISRSMAVPLMLEGRHGCAGALDIQSMYLEKVRSFCATRGTDPEEADTLELWGRTLDGLKQLRISWTNGVIEDDPSDLKRKLDWVMKLWLISRIKDKAGVGIHDWRLKLLDLGYHDLNPRTSLHEQCVALNLFDRMIGEDKIRKARTEPPLNTRAEMRGMIIQRAAGENVDVLIDNWEEVSIVARPQGQAATHPFDRYRRMVKRLKITLEDPLMSADASVIERMETFVQAWSGEPRIGIEKDD